MRHAIFLSAYYCTVEILLLQCRDLRGGGGEAAFYEITKMEIKFVVTVGAYRCSNDSQPEFAKRE